MVGVSKEHGWEGTAAKILLSGFLASSVFSDGSVCLLLVSGISGT